MLYLQKKQNMPLWKRTMKRDCGNVIDRDRNSAINIMKQYYETFPITECFLGITNKLGVSFDKQAY